LRSFSCPAKRDSKAEGGGVGVAHAAGFVKSPGATGPGAFYTR